MSKDNELFAKTPEPPYYAVIFTSTQGKNLDGYGEMGEILVEVAASQPGCLGLETTRGENGLGITVSYWKDEDSIRKWKAMSKHLAAQRAGIERWYSHYELRVAKVERAYSGPDGRDV